MGLVGMGIEVMGKMGMGMHCWSGNGNDLMGVRREWEQEIIPTHLYCTETLKI